MEMAATSKGGGWYSWILLYYLWLWLNFKREELHIL